MHLESLELDNFKSFGNRKKIMFKNGFTVISGPNGSGKSNIGDSLLFVLGTRSSKTVRADRLGDLIHKSSNEKRNRNYCSVTVTLDKDEADSPEDQRKIILKRELVADAEGYKSNYYINGTRVRHTDVANLLDSIHIYLDSYSFVLQGDINNIVKMTGFERRKLLESISGIESFDTQIDKAKVEIDAINENLSRLEVLTEQTRIRRDQLEVEKKSAERYLELTGRLSDLRKTLLSLEMEGLGREQRSYTDNLEKLELEITTIKDSIYQLEKEFEEKKSLEAQLQHKLEVSGNSQLNEIRLQIDNKRVRIAEIGVSLENSRDRIKELKEELEENVDNIKKSGKKIEWLESNRNENGQTLSRIKKEIQEKSNELRILKERSSKSNSQILERQEKIREKDQEIKNLNNEIAVHQESKQAKSTERSQLISQLGNIEERKKDLEFNIRDALWRLKDIEREVGGNKRSYEDLNARYYKLKNRLDDLRKRKDQIQQDLNRLGREHAQLQATSNTRTGNVSRAVSTIMNARNHNSIRGIHGTIRELISFDDEYRSAIEASAGSRLNSVVVEDDAVAEECLNLLKAEKAGKLTFLPINKVLAGRPRGKAITVHQSDGSRGYVFEKVSFDQKYQGVIWYAFQDTVIVHDVKTARRYMVGVRLVTMDGDIFEASGAITGGYIEKSRSAADVEQKMGKLSSDMRELSIELEGVDSEIGTLESEFETVSHQLRESSRDEGSRQTELQQYRKISEEGKAQLEQFDLNIAQLTRDMKISEESIRDIEDIIKGLQEKNESLDQEKARLFEEIRELSPKYAERETALEDSISSLREKETEFASELSRINADIDHLKERIQELESKNHETTSDISEIQNQIKSQETEVKIENEELSKLRAIEAEISEKSREIVDALNRNENEMRKIEERIEINNSNISAKREIIVSLQIKIENIEAKISDVRLEMETVGGKILQDRKSAPEIKREIDACNISIAELGPVNQRAIEDYGIVSRDLDALVLEVGELNSEKKELEILTEKLNEQKKRAFMEMYLAINENMKLIYREISGGGEAHLEMSDENDPLNSEVFIRARPKGTNFSKIEALSGGEKSLTALSFILAVQRINPSPIYYLDEVDMFLDGANAERVGKMFRLNSNTSQVFAVSLRKAMLKYADNVIGVTSFDQENTEVFEKYVGSDQEALT